MALGFGCGRYGPLQQSVKLAPSVHFAFCLLGSFLRLLGETFFLSFPTLNICGVKEGHAICSRGQTSAKRAGGCVQLAVLCAEVLLMSVYIGGWAMACACF